MSVSLIGTAAGCVGCRRRSCAATHQVGEHLFGCPALGSRGCGRVARLLLRSGSGSCGPALQHLLDLRDALVCLAPGHPDAVIDLGDGRAVGTACRRRGPVVVAFADGARADSWLQIGQCNEALGRERLQGGDRRGGR